LTKEVAPFQFRDVNGQGQVAFKKDGEAPLRLMIDFPFMVFDKVPWYQHDWFKKQVLARESIIGGFGPRRFVPCRANCW
jgi:hypothetical protein